MDKIKDVISQIESCIATEFENGCEKINTCEMGQVADILKDLTMAVYYCTVSDSMENYSERDMDLESGKMYFTQSKKISNPLGNRDLKEGGAGIFRKTYIESKEIHGNDVSEMDKLEDYLATIENDIVELKPKMTAPEMSMVKNKLLKMANSIE